MQVIDPKGSFLKNLVLSLLLLGLSSLLIPFVLKQIDDRKFVDQQRFQAELSRQDTILGVTDRARDPAPSAREPANPTAAFCAVIGGLLVGVIPSFALKLGLGRILIISAGRTFRHSQQPVTRTADAPAT